MLVGVAVGGVVGPTSSVQVGGEAAREADHLERCKFVEASVRCEVASTVELISVRSSMSQYQRDTGSQDENVRVIEWQRNT